MLGTPWGIFVTVNNVLFLPPFHMHLVEILFSPMGQGACTILLLQFETSQKEKNTARNHKRMVDLSDLGPILRRLHS